MGMHKKITKGLRLSPERGRDFPTAHGRSVAEVSVTDLLPAKHEAGM